MVARAINCSDGTDIMRNGGSSDGYSEIAPSSVIKKEIKKEPGLISKYFTKRSPYHHFMLYVYYIANPGENLHDPKIYGLCP